MKRLCVIFLGLICTLLLGVNKGYAAEIVGRVRGSDAKAIKGARVTLFKLVGEQAPITAQVPITTDTTGKEGNYRLQIKDSDFGQLLAASMRVEITASPPGGAPASAQPQSKELIVRRDATRVAAPEISLNMPGTGDPITVTQPAPELQPGRGSDPGSPTARIGAADLKGGKTIEQVAEKGKIITLADRLDPRKPAGEPIGQLWRTMLNITNGAAILVFLVMGFATIFSVQVDTYGVKKALPNVIIALILANFSLFITRMVVDVANIFIVSIVNSQPNGVEGLIDGLVGSFISGGRDTLGNLLTDFASGAGFNAPSAIKAIVFVGAIYTAGGYLLLGAVLLAALAIIIPSIFILILAVLFYVRTYVILALAVVSPLAFISFALPATQVLFRQWWTQLVRWAMLGPIAFFMIWLGIEFSQAFDDQFEFGIYLVTLAFLYLAISLPFKMGGVITANVGKYLGKPLRQAAGFGAKWYGRTSDVMSGAISQRFGGRPITIGGIVKGWSLNADRYYQRHVAKSAGAGEDIREAVASGAMGLLRPLEFGGRVKRAISIMRTGERYQQAVQKQVTSEAQQIAALPEESVAGGLAEALQHKDHGKAAQYLVAKAMQGGNVQEDFDKIYAAGLHKSPELKAALSTAQIEAAKNSNLAVNPADGDGAARKAHDIFSKNNANKPQNQLETIMNRFLKEMEGNPGINESNIARYQFIEDFASDKFRQEHDAELEPFRASVEIADVNVDQNEVNAAIDQISHQETEGALKYTFDLDASKPFGKSQVEALLAMERIKLSPNFDANPLKGEISGILSQFEGQLNAYKNRGQINSWIRRSATGRYSGLTTPPPEEEIKIAKELVANPQVMLGLRFNREQVLSQARREIEAINAEMGRLVAGQKQFDLKTVINLQSQIRGKLGAADFNKITGQLNRMRLAEESVMHPRQILEKYQGKVKGIKELLAKLH